MGSFLGKGGGAVEEGRVGWEEPRVCTALIKYKRNSI